MRFLTRRWWQAYRELRLLVAAPPDRSSAGDIGPWQESGTPCPVDILAPFLQLPSAEVIDLASRRLARLQANELPSA